MNPSPSDDTTLACGASPASSEAAGAPPSEGNGQGHCRNCGARLVGPHCAECGQEARRRAVPVAQLGRDALGEVFSFDARFLCSLRLLLAKPGRLTSEYFAGRRKRYVPPVRLYVFVSFVYFLLGALTSDPISIDVGDSQISIEASAAAEGVSGRASTMETASDSLAAEAESVFRERLSGEGFRQYIQAYQNNLSLVYFFLLPLVALGLKLIYLRRAWLYVHHLIFVLHLQAFYFAAFVPALGMKAVVPADASDWWTKGLGVVAVVASAVYWVLAIKHFYGQSWRKTILKALLLAGVYAVTFGAIGLISAVGYVLVFT